VKLIIVDDSMPLKSSTSASVNISGEYALAGLQHWNSSKRRVYAFHIPGLDQTLDVVAGERGVLPPPSAPSRLEGGDGYTTFEVSLKSRPSKTVKLRLKTNSPVLLDDGGTAAKTLTLNFTRQNWNIPQTVRARSADGHFGPQTVILRESIVASSAVEYIWVSTTRAQVEVPADSFALDTPADAATVVSPAVVRWRAYSLATRYVLRLHRMPNGAVVSIKLKPADVCVADLCSVTLDAGVLKPGRSYRWRLTAQDTTANFQKTTPWRQFTLAPGP
jgi:hypothetical protein